MQRTQLTLGLQHRLHLEESELLVGNGWRQYCLFGVVP
jgi:hypothetical protein